MVELMRMEPQRALPRGKEDRAEALKDKRHTREPRANREPPSARAGSRTLVFACTQHSEKGRSVQTENQSASAGTGVGKLQLSGGVVRELGGGQGCGTCPLSELTDSHTCNTDFYSMLQLTTTTTKSISIKFVTNNPSWRSQVLE